MKANALKLALLITLTCALAGCGRTYHVKGRVVLLPQLGSDGGIICEMTGQPMPTGGTAIEGARVRLIHDFDDNGQPKAESVWQSEARTDANGYFEISSYAAPYDNALVGLEVSKAGYKTVMTKYIDYLDAEHDKTEKTQFFFVVLAQN